MPRPQIGQELSNVPFSELVSNLGLAIAEAQFAMDETGIRLAQMMGGEYEVTETNPVTGQTTSETKKSLVKFDGQELSMLELGFTPTFYQFTEATIEIKISISFSQTTEYERTRSTRTVSAVYTSFFIGAYGRVKATSVSARYANQFNYSAEGSSLMRAKIMPIPAPAVLEERIRAIVERNAANDGGNP